QTKEKMKKFISDKVRPEDEVVMFIAGLGGGTGTSTIVKAISEFHDYHNKPLMKEELKKIISTPEGKARFTSNQSEVLNEALNNAKERFKKIVVIATLPLRSDGTDVLRQVNSFAQDIWKMAKDETKGIAHVIFPDNEFFNVEYKKAKNTLQNQGIQNYRDYANSEIANTIHELNTGATSGNTSIVLDKMDLRRIWLDHHGSLLYSKVEVPVSTVQTEDDLVKLFEKAFNEPSLHGPVELTKKNEDGTLVLPKKINHVGLFAVVDNKNKYGKGAFIETAKEKFVENHVLSPNSTVFSGFIENQNNGKITVYVFYKAEALPERLEKGLVKEYEEYMERLQEISFASTDIESIKQVNKKNLDLDISAFGFDDEIAELIGEAKQEQVADDNDEISDEELDKLLDLDLSKFRG
ncbi:cell division protein FtsZ, partial [Butyricicoccus sp. 1XD8-22]